MTPKAVGQRCEAQHMQSGVKKPQRHNARLGIFIARVLPDHCRTEIGLGHPLEAQAAFTDVALILRIIEPDFHCLYCNNDLLKMQR